MCWKRKTKRPRAGSAGCFALILCLAAIASAQSEPTGSIGNAVVARVNGEPIFLSDLNESALDHSVPLSALTSDGIMGDGFRKAITARVDEMLLVQAAREEEIKVDDTEISRRVDLLLRQLEERLGGSDQFLQFLRGMYLGPDTLRKMMTEREKRNSLAATVVGRRVNISNVEIAEFQQRRASEGNSAEEVQLAQILIRCPKAEQGTEIGNRQYQKALQAARDAGRDPARFAEIARQVSDDPAGREQGGLLGWIDPNVLMSELRNRVLLMRLNEVSEPIASDDGYHVLLLIDRRTARDLLFSEKFTQERTKLLTMLRENAKIEIYPLNPQEISGAR